MVKANKKYKGYEINIGKDEPDYKYGIRTEYFLSSIKKPNGVYMDKELPENYQESFYKSSDAYAYAKKEIDKDIYNNKK